MVEGRENPRRDFVVTTLVELRAAWAAAKAERQRIERLSPRRHGRALRKAAAAETAALNAYNARFELAGIDERAELTAALRAAGL